MRLCQLEGTARHMRNLNGQTPDRYGAINGPHSWGNDIESTGGECAFATAYGYPWPKPFEQRKDGDVDGKEVRWTWRKNGRLLVHDDDDGSRVFVLVTGLMPNYVLRGWCFGWEAKQPKFWDEPQPGRPCYCAPQRILWDMPDPEKIKCARHVAGRVPDRAVAAVHTVVVP
jgi:YD repeat-containing protein